MLNSNTEKKNRPKRQHTISVNKARLVLTRTLQLALSWNSPTFSYFFIFLTFFFTNEEKTKNPPGALETRDVALQDDHKKERKRRVQHRYTLLNENIILNFKTGRENSICIETMLIKSTPNGLLLRIFVETDPTIYIVSEYVELRHF